MNKTKRKIFDTAMKLFAEKGYSETSVEEITAVTGIAKGTLYYHFAKKEDIFYFLTDEGMKLLKNSIEIKAYKKTSAIEKLREIILIQIKIIVKYEELITLILSQMWGKTERNMKSQECMRDFIAIIEDVVKEGIQNGEIKEMDSNVIATNIFGVMCTGMLYKMNHDGNIDVEETCDKFFNTIIEGIRA